MDRRRFLVLSGSTLIATQLSACGAEKTAAIGVPKSRFDDDSTAEEVTKGVDLDGKLAIVTGCTSGIGFETMRVLALRGAYVVGTSRSLERAETACRKVVGLTSPVQLDLGDYESVVRCADQIRSLQTPIDILVLNAAYRGGGNNRTVLNGVEKHFSINHLGHFILVNRLLERLYLAWQGRIVVVSSRAAYGSAPDEGIKFDDLVFRKKYSDSRAYGHSKLANALFSLRLAELLRGTRITTNSLHPGIINTDIDRNQSAFRRFAWGVITGVSGKSVEEGAATSCYVATAEALGATSGAYFEDCNPIVVGDDSHMHDQAMAEKLMRVSQELTADYLVEQKRPDWNDFENGVRRPQKADGGDDLDDG